MRLLEEEIGEIISFLLLDIYPALNYRLRDGGIIEIEISSINHFWKIHEILNDSMEY